MRLQYKLNQLLAGLLVGVFLSAGVLFIIFALAAVATKQPLQLTVDALRVQRGSALFYVCVLMAGLLGGNVVTRTVYFFIKRPSKIQE